MSPYNMRKIYLDNQSTTQIDPQVMELMLPWFTQKYGNAASRSHHFGWEAEEAVDIAREQISKLIHATPQEIIFTSGATESNNLALKGITETSSKQEKHIISVCTEHKSILDPLNILSKSNCKVTYLGINKDGKINLQRLKEAVNSNTIIISIMHANNEIGVIHPIEEIGNFCKDNNILFHTDAAQSLGKILINVEKFNIDILSISSHKIYGPKGVGALYVRNKSPRIQLKPLFDGGGHERGLRSGTLPVPLIVGFGKACEIAELGMEKESNRILKLKNLFIDKIFESIDGVNINGSIEQRLPGNINLSFEEISGNNLLNNLSTIAVSSGSACTSASPEPSYVLKALGLSKEEANASIRFSIGRFNTEKDINIALKTVVDTVNLLRKESFSMKRKTYKKIQPISI